MINIKVFNREDALMQGYVEPTAVISIYTPGDEPAEFEMYGGLKGVCKLAFDDLCNDGDFEITPINGGSKRRSSPITDAQADEIAGFVAGMLASGVNNFTIHCDAGMSRSPGVAVALEELINQDKTAYKRYPLHNTLVASKVRKAFQKLVVK